MSSNFRHQLLSLSLLVGIAAPWAAFAQAPISSVGSGSVEDRVTQLERISNAHSQLNPTPSNNSLIINPILIPCVVRFRKISIN